MRSRLRSACCRDVCRRCSPACSARITSSACAWRAAACEAPAAATAAGAVEAALPEGQLALRAPMAGRLVQFNAAEGDTLAAGAEALVLEAMKM